MLKKSRLAEHLIDIIGHLAGGLRGDMALGTIGAAAAATEAGSMGALGVSVAVALARRLSLAVLKDVMQTTLRVSAMVLVILVCAPVFSLAFHGLQGRR